MNEFCILLQLFLMFIALLVGWFSCRALHLFQQLDRRFQAEREADLLDQFCYVPDDRQ